MRYHACFLQTGFFTSFMAINIFKKMFGSRNDRQLKRMSRVVAQINELEPDFKALSDDALRAKRMNSGSVWSMARHWMTCYLRPLQPYGRPPGVPSRCAILTCS